MKPRLLVFSTLLALAASCALPAAAQTPSSPPTQSQIMQALMNDQELSQYALTATVAANGLITLNGSVPNKTDKQHAANLVKSLAAGSKLQNSIVVDPTTTPLQGTAASSPQTRAAGQGTPNATPASDPVTAKIQTALAADPALSAVQVAINGNDLTLSGTVATAKAKSRAATLARQNAPGLKIHNQIAVKKGS